MDLIIRNEPVDLCDAPTDAGRHTGQDELRRHPGMILRIKGVADHVGGGGDEDAGEV